MSNPLETPWSNHPNAPQIPLWLYLGDKGTFAGVLIGTILYGMLSCRRYPSIVAHLASLAKLLGVAMALFFQCMWVLLSPTNTIKGAKKWALVAHTVAMFTFLTIPTGIGLNFSSTCYINNRGFPGDDKYPPGPIGYYHVLQTEATNIVFTIMFPLNQWLADGLLVGLIPKRGA